MDDNDDINIDVYDKTSIDVNKWIIKDDDIPDFVLIKRRKCDERIQSDIDSVNNTDPEHNTVNGEAYTEFGDIPSKCVESNGVDPKDDDNSCPSIYRESISSFTFGKSFKELGVPDWLLDLSRSMSIKKPTKIQELCLPLGFKGKNIIGCAQTGTGKTICFCWPILVSLMKDPYGVYALVITSSRELAFQIGDQFKLYGVQMNLHVSICVGGVDIVNQSIELEKRPHIVVGTPGRLYDQVMIPERNIRGIFTNVKYLILDEADKLLTKCFETSLQNIIKCLPPTSKGRITHLYSATITDSIILLSKSFKDVKFHFFDVTDGKGQTSLYNELRLDHYYTFLPQNVHLTYLVYLLINDFNDVKRQGIIFVATKKRCQHISTTLDILKFKVTCIHSLMKQKKRNACLAKFRSGHCQLLIATDLVSRGIDVPSVEFVFNLDFPKSPQDYIHRVGRCGRAGKRGLSISFIDDKDIEKIKCVEEEIQMKMTEYKIKDDSAVKLLNKVTIAYNKAKVLLDEVERLEA